MRAHYKLYMTNQNKIFKTVIDLVALIVLYILLLALFVGVLNILLNIKSILFGTLGGGFGQIVSGVLTVFVSKPVHHWKEYKGILFIELPYVRRS